MVIWAWGVCDIGVGGVDNIGNGTMVRTTVILAGGFKLMLKWL